MDHTSKYFTIHAAAATAMSLSSYFQVNAARKFSTLARLAALYGRSILVSLFLSLLPFAVSHFRIDFSGLLLLFFFLLSRYTVARVLSRLPPLFRSIFNLVTVEINIFSPYISSQQTRKLQFVGLMGAHLPQIARAHENDILNVKGKHRTIPITNDVPFRAGTWDFAGITSALELAIQAVSFSCSFIHSLAFYVRLTVCL